MLFGTEFMLWILSLGTGKAKKSSNHFQKEQLFSYRNPSAYDESVQLPRLNRLTGLRWWRSRSPRPTSRAMQEAAIRKMILQPGPCAIGKIGTSELFVLEYSHRWIRLPWPPSASWHRPAKRLFQSGGLFPLKKQIFDRFLIEYPEAVKSLDMVAEWQTENTYEAAVEHAMVESLCPHAVRVGFFLVKILNPHAPWLNDLATLRWLVIHPFAQTIRAQLPNLSMLGVYSSAAKSHLQDRALDTSIIACPQLPYMVPPRHRDWFEALEDLKAQMERETFDIALVGAGAWSLPLVAHAKKLGKKGIHLGGSLQLLFGIKGGRYDNNGIYNEAWTRPLPNEVPPNFKKMEEGAYW